MLEAKIAGHKKLVAKAIRVCNSYFKTPHVATHCADGGIYFEYGTATLYATMLPGDKTVVGFVCYDPARNELHEQVIQAIQDEADKLDDTLD